MSFDWDVADAIAVKAVAAGNASPDQQTRVFRFIVDELCLKGRLSFGGDDRTTNFNEGRRFVGVVLANMAASTADAIRDRHARETAGPKRPKTPEQRITEATFAGRPPRATKGD